MAGLRGPSGAYELRSSPSSQSPTCITWPSFRHSVGFGILVSFVIFGEAPNIFYSKKKANTGVRALGATGAKRRWHSARRYFRGYCRLTPWDSQHCVGRPAALLQTPSRTKASALGAQILLSEPIVAGASRQQRTARGF